MYISSQRDVCTVSADPRDAVTEILPPLYRTEEGEISLPPYTLTEGGQWVSADHRFSVTLTLTPLSDTLFSVSRSWKNVSSAPARLQTVFRLRTCFVPNRYLIPCVSHNGNEFGGGGEPKGLTRDGKPWVFAYDRVSIPSCTLTENRDFAVALFASARDTASLVSSCSLCKGEDGRFVQELIHPLVESPVTYSNRDLYAPAYETYLELAPGEIFSCEMYLSVSRPRWENFGICHTLDAALTLFGDPLPYPPPDKRRLWQDSISYAHFLLSDYKGKRGFVIGRVPDGKGGFEIVSWGKNNFELAWCGQNILFCRMLIEDYLRFGQDSSLSVALEILDTRVELCTAESGLLAAQLRDYENLNQAVSDTCNMGYGAYELLLVWETLQGMGVDKPAYLRAGRGLCDFFCTHFSEEYGFGKSWRLDGTCLDKNGSIGVFIIPALAKLYALTREEIYLTMAERALDFYTERDLNRFVCTAGALDTGCVDKETSVPFLISALLLYELTGKDRFITYAEKAAYYFTSWMFHYDPIYGEDSDLTCLGVGVKGLTSVSAQHHHLDMYALLVVPYLRRLAEITGDSRWSLRAEMMFRATLSFVGDGRLSVHGSVRPVGGQNEAVFHCRWQHGVEKRGALNDWLVAWPCAFRLWVLASERDW